MTMGDLRMGTCSVSEGEGLEVDAPLGHAGPRELGGERARQRVGAAQVDVAAADVRDDAPERRGIDANAVARADELDEPSAAPTGLSGDLVAQDEIRRCRAAQQHGDVGLGRQPLHEREYRRRADAGSDQQHAIALGRVRREGPVRALDHDPRSGGEARQPRAVVAEVLTVMRRRSPSGAADSEYGCACHHSPRRRKRHWKNWPPATGSRSSLRPRRKTDTTPGPSGTTPTTQTRWRSERHTGSPTRASTTTASVPSHSPVHQRRATGWPTNEAPVSIWCENDRKSAR